MVEGLGEVCPVEVGVDTKHLAEDRLTDINEVLWEATSLTDPVRLARVCQLRERCRGDVGIVCVRDAGSFSREDGGIIDLAADPSLHKRYVLVSRQFDRLSTAVQPGE